MNDSIYNRGEYKKVVKEITPSCVGCQEYDPDICNSGKCVTGELPITNPLKYEGVRFDGGKVNKKINYDGDPSN
ncbi:hypothetical protein C4565_02340 [Candidatus Parcubacteria bacterium]|jgi:hypothetical protein|nr:MAG: hypothetical protein C4565_02340 [Candidatus Parcubacteria bacterium]